MGRDTLTPTPNIPWSWDHDDNGNVEISIRGTNGALAEVVLTPQEARGFSGAIQAVLWKVDSKAHQARLMRQVEESNAHDRHMYTGRGDL